jgi:OHCU decarboxylase
VKYTIASVNELGPEEFVQLFGPVFEHSPWVAERTWPKRPFASPEALHQALGATVADAAPAEQLALIRAHPDLVGRAALAGTLTPASRAEQASAGLDRLSPEESARFQELNRQYREKFGFPFVICARLNKQEAILSGFAARLQHSRGREIETALSEIGKIAWLRLQEFILPV